MRKMVTIKIEPEARDALQKISAQTGEKQYALVARLALQAKRELADLAQVSRLTDGKWQLRFVRKQPKPKRGKK